MKAEQTAFSWSGNRLGVKRGKDYAFELKPDILFMISWITKSN